MYNLARYKFQPGQRVVIVDGYGEARCEGIARHKVSGELVAEWDYAKGNTGTIVKVENFGKRQNVPPWIIVKPDEGFGFGEHMFTVKEIRHE